MTTQVSSWLVPHSFKHELHINGLILRKLNRLISFSLSCCLFFMSLLVWLLQREVCKENIKLNVFFKGWEKMEGGERWHDKQRVISSFCIMSQAERPVLPHNRHPCCSCPPPRVSSLCLQVRLNLKDVLFWPRLINASKPLPASSSSQICFSRRCSTARMWRWVSPKHLRGFYFQVWEKFRLFF